MSIRSISRRGTADVPTDATARGRGQAQADAWISTMHLYVAVARERSFSRAAERTGVPHSTLSRRISQLERHLGFRLLTRTTRRVELTEEGQEYLERAERVVADALTIHEDLRYRRGKPSGLLRISIPECIALQVATPWIAEFSSLYPEVTIQIDTAPEHANLVRDGFDICITHVPVSEPAVVRRTVASFKQILLASPGYLSRHGIPATPEDLAAHHCICLSNDRAGSNVWTLEKEGRKVAVEVSGPVTTFSQVLAPELAKEGLGIASAMPGPFQHYVDAGLLQPILEDWEMEHMVISILLPDRLVAARTRAFIDFFIAKYQSVIAQYG